MDALRVEHHLRRADDFLEGTRFTTDDASVANSSALLAIHSALSYNDALRAGLGAAKLSANDHSSVVNDMDRLIPPNRIRDRSGLEQLKILLAKKSAVAYGDGRIAAQDMKALTTRAERFARWANNIAKELKIEGWRRADQ
jgi:hypothetical protein